jgi:hypothetical protein
LCCTAEGAVVPGAIEVVGHVVNSIVVRALRSSGWLRYWGGVVLVCLRETVLFLCAQWL